MNNSFRLVNIFHMNKLIWSTRLHIYVNSCHCLFPCYIKVNWSIMTLASIFFSPLSFTRIYNCIVWKLQVYENKKTKKKNKEKKRKTKRKGQKKRIWLIIVVSSVHVLKRDNNLYWAILIKNKRKTKTNYYI